MENENKGNRKSWMILIAVVCAVVAIIVGGVIWAVVKGPYDYEKADGGIAITRYNGNDKDVVIPDRIDDMPVKSIDSYAFAGCRNLRSIEIPDSVEKIGNYAFSDCYGLTSITIKDGVTSVGADAFFNCTALTSIRIPDSVEEIGISAFYGCDITVYAPHPASFYLYDVFSQAAYSNLLQATSDSDEIVAFKPEDDPGLNEIAPSYFGGNVTWIVE